MATTKLNMNTMMLAALALLAVSGVVAGINLVGVGHAAFNTTSSGLVWGFPIVVYDYFLLTSTGLALVASLALVFGATDFYAVAKRCVWLALAGFIGGVAALFLELGHPLRALYATPLNFQYLSPLFWKVLFIGAYVILLVVTFSRIHRPGWDRGSVRGVGLATLIAALGVTLIAGSVYGMMAMRPFWHGGEVPVVFLVESFLGGLAFAMFFAYLAHGFSQAGMPDKLRALLVGPMPLLFAAVIALHIAFVLSRAITGLWSNADGLEVWNHIARSPLFHFELWVGLVLPLVLMALPGTRTKAGNQTLAAALVMLALFIGRYDYIIGGQLVPLFKGNWVPGLIQYAPSLTEWMILLAAIGIANVVNAYGERSFNLEAQPAERG
jgi:molybdopterin-containing oxidoreductase family membrane subunit